MIYTKTVHSDELTTQVPLAFREAKGTMIKKVSNFAYDLTIIVFFKANGVWP